MEMLAQQQEPTSLGSEGSSPDFLATTLCSDHAQNCCCRQATEAALALVVAALVGVPAVVR